ncbi:VPA1262 family protein [Delftia acidovorans]|uniref:VPA1262 family protein n=1 Tax=Delftia acidovorans TaxID=80866 RepID=UPI00192AC160|nr:VPA1262 family protein [Delftia acidovorans]
MNPSLDALVSDFRLYNLFGDDGTLSTTQVWLLEIKSEEGRELRFVYGRSLPGTYKSDGWIGTSSGSHPLGDNGFAIFHGLTLHTDAKQLKAFLQRFTGGVCFREASAHAGISVKQELLDKVGEAVFGARPHVRPVMHLPTRDYFGLRSRRLSPTNFASVDSGAVFSQDKSHVLTVADGWDRKITKFVCSVLDADTGMNFSDLDAWRLGDFELLCAPSLTSTERRKYAFTLKGERPSLKLFEPLTQEPTDLMLVLTLYSDGGVQESCVTRLDRSTAYPLEHPFVIEGSKSQSATAFTLEIYALGDEGSGSWMLLQTGNYFMRSMNLHMQVNDSIRGADQMGWLKRQVPIKEKAKLQAAARVARAVHASRSTFGGDPNDPWVNLNRSTEDRIHDLLPKASKGNFFPTLSDSGGMSRLSLVDWLRKIFDRHHDAEIAWIDPYMEDVGIDLLHRMGSETGKYLIITTEKNGKEEGPGGTAQPTRMQRLLASCAGWGHGYFGNVHLRVLAVPESRLHDRMILIRSADGRPLEGYHLSNSIQRANENFPLLATPIPADVLPGVFEFADRTIQSTLHGDEKIAPTAKLIFDSTAFRPEAQQPTQGLNNRSSFVDPARSGDVLAWWLDDPDVAGLSGQALNEGMQAKGHLKDGELNSERFLRIPSKFWSTGFPMEQFHGTWDAMGYVLADTRAGELFEDQDAPLPEAVKQQLRAHLNVSRSDALPPKVKKSYIDIEYYRIQSFSALLLSSAEPANVFCYSPVDIAWGDYYALKILWSKAPQDVIEWLGATCAEPFDEQPRRRALVIEALKLICSTLGFDKNPARIEALLQSPVSLLQWVGVHAFKDAINHGSFGIDALGKIDLIEPRDVQRTVLCWLINEANYVGSAVRENLIAKLMQSIKASLTDQQLQDILEPMRGRLGTLYHFSPWILESLLISMLELKAINVAQVSRAWMGEITRQWRAALKEGRVSFTVDGDAAFSDELAILTLHLAPQDRVNVFDELWRVLRSIARTIRKPLSAQIDWRAYSCAHGVNLWLHALARRIAALVHTDEYQPLAELLAESQSLIERWPSFDWESSGNRELLMYSTSDPAQIASQRLLHTIGAALSHNG